MAVTCFSSPYILLQRSRPVVKNRTRSIMLKHSQIPVKKAPTLSVRSSFQDKVFENKSEGIICYRDDSGEIICEGFDEGPRFHHHLPRTAYNSRDAEIINLLQQRLIHIVNGGDFDNSDNGVMTLKEDFKWNEFNKFC